MKLSLEQLAVPTRYATLVAANVTPTAEGYALSAVRRIAFKGVRMKQAYFLTVDWCKKGQRGIFCDTKGNGFRKNDAAHTEDEMSAILGAFSLILAPKSELFTVEQVARFTRWIPLAEYACQFGVALDPQAWMFPLHDGTNWHLMKLSLGQLAVVYTVAFMHFKRSAMRAARLNYINWRVS